MQGSRLTPPASKEPNWADPGYRIGGNPEPGPASPLRTRNPPHGGLDEVRLRADHVTIATGSCYFTGTHSSRCPMPGTTTEELSTNRIQSPQSPRTKVPPLPGI